MRRSLTDQERLRKRGDIKSLFSSGSSQSCKGLKMVKVPNGLGYSRFLFSPGRQCSNAVERNYCKRISREILRNIKDRLVPGYDVAVVIFPGLFSFKDREKQFLQVLARSRLLINPETKQNLE